MYGRRGGSAMSEFDKGYFQGAQPGNYEQQQGVWARQREQRLEQEAAAAAARERDERFQRDFLAANASAQQPIAGVGTYSPAGSGTPVPFRQIVSRTAMVVLVCTALFWFFLLDRPAGPDLIGVLSGGYIGGAVLGAGLWALGWALHFVGIALRVALKFTMAAGFLLALFYLLTGRLPF